MKKKEEEWKIRIGKFLFRFRSFTLLPLIILVFLLFPPQNLGSSNWIVSLGGFLIALLGELIRILAVGFSLSGTSGRENYLKALGINKTGLYSITRNPLYIGNVFIFIGLLIVFSNPLAILVFGLFLILQYYFIIVAEEKFLSNRHGESYRRYCQTVSRIFPGLKNFKKPDIRFNLRKVIFKENDSIFHLLMMFLVILFFREMTFHGRIRNAVVYIGIGSCLIMVYVLIKILKKRKKTDW